MKSQENTEKKVSMGSRVPESIKEKVEAFAKKTKRTMSASIHYLLDTHPELDEKIVTEKVEVTA